MLLNFTLAPLHCDLCFNMRAACNTKTYDISVFNPKEAPIP